MFFFFIRTPPPPNSLVAQSTIEKPTSSSITRLTSSFNGNIQQQPIKARSVTSCGHHDHGQELCRLCYQRAKRNIPVYINEEKRDREKEDGRLLEEYLHNRDVEEQRKREVN